MYLDAYVSGRRYGGYQFGEYRIKVKSRKMHAAVLVTFLKTEDNSEHGSFEIDPIVDRRLGAKLLQAADGCFAIGEDVSLKVRQNIALTKKSVAFNNLMIGDISELNLSRSTVEKLKKSGIIRVIDLLMKTEDELLDVPKLSAAAVKEIKATLKEANLSLGFKFRE